LDAKLSQDPKLAPLYGLEQAHALLDDVCDLMGVGDTSRYMKQPDDPQVQQQLAMQSQQSQQMMQMQQRMAMLEAQLGQSKDQREWTKVRSDALLNQAKVTDMFEDNTHDDEVLQFDRDKAAAEYALERDQRRPAAIQ
jgi:DNA-directed RNA polymerase sigma subunit (sigma70/sigma32)